MLEEALGPERAVERIPARRRARASLSSFTVNHPRKIVLALVALAALPILVAGLGGLSHTFYPGDDWAVIGFDTLDVGTVHTPLLGVYSRYGWNHPGPMMFWLYAIPFRVSGESFSSLLFAAAVINFTAVVGMITFAWRRGGLALAALVAIVCALMAHTLGMSILRDPWNAWVTVLPLGLLILAAWAATEGDKAGLIVTAIVGSFLTQTHVGFVPMVGALILVAGIGYHRRVHRARPLFLALGVTVACWLPVIADVIAGGDNVAKLVSYFGTNGEPTAGIGYAVGVVDVELGGRGAWLGGPETVNSTGGGLLAGSMSSLMIAVVPFVLAYALAWHRRKRQPEPFRLLNVVGITALAGLFAVSHISGPVFNYLVRWWWPIAGLWWASIGWAFWCALRETVRLDVRAVAVASGVGLLGLVSLQTTTAYAGLVDSTDLNRNQAPLDGFVSEALPRVPADAPVLYRSVGPDVRWVGDGFALQLARSGHDLRVDDTGTNREKFGEQRIAKPDPGNRVVWVVSGAWIDDFERQGGGRELAKWDPLSPQERQEFRDLRNDMLVKFEAAKEPTCIRDLDSGGSMWRALPVKGVLKSEIQRYDQLNDRGQPVAIFLFDHANLANIPPHH